MCRSFQKSTKNQAKKKFSQKLTAGTNLGIMSAIAKYSKVLSTSIYKLVPLSAVVFTPAFLTTAPALAAVDRVCYLVSDVGGGNGGNDFLVKMDTNTGQFFQIGSGTGTSNIEAAAAQPGTNILFAASQESSGQLGTIDLITGVFTPRANQMGTGDGDRGSINFRDPDGLAFDPTDGTLYASIRTGDGRTPPDILIKVDPVTGQHIPNAFGAGVDYVEIEPQQQRNDIDGIVIDPADGTMYGIANQGGSGGKQYLVTINKNSGATNEVGELRVGNDPIDDVEDIAFDLNNKLYVSTGSTGNEKNRLYDVDKNTAIVSNPRPVTIGGDYEASGCFLLPPVDVSLNKTVNNSNPNFNEFVTFTLTLTNDVASNNDAYSDINNLVVEDILPANLEFDSFVSTPSGSTSTYNAATRTVTWNINEVLKGNNTTLQFRARVTGSGSITNSAEVTSIREFDVDSTPNNNQATEDDQSSVSLTATASNPDVILVKRITAINGNRTENPNDNTPLNTFVDDTVSARQDDDNHPNWLDNYLIGAINAGKIKPGDEIEYTVYFLNAGNSDGENLRICDRITPFQDFKLNAYGTGNDLQLKLANNSEINLTSASDNNDRAQLISTTGTVPTNCNLKGANDNGTLLIDITGTGQTNQSDLTSIPGSTGKGTPDNSYGFFRFTTTVKP